MCISIRIKCITKPCVQGLCCTKCQSSNRYFYTENKVDYYVINMCHVNVSITFTVYLFSSRFYGPIPFCKI